MRNSTATARPPPADPRSVRRQVGAAAGAKTRKAVKPPARTPGSSEAAPALELSPGPALLEGPTREDLIRIRAYDRYERSGHGHGHDVDDWLAAEAEICAITSPGANGAGALAG